MAIDRRGFLGALALAPAVAACSTPAAVGKAAPPAAAAPAAAPAPPTAPGLDAVRAHPLPRSAEPAFTFSAAAVRAGEP